MKKIRKLIYTYFIRTNENDILQLEIAEDDITRIPSEVNREVLDELDKLVLERKMDRYFVNNLPEVDHITGIYYRILKDGLIEIFNDLGIEILNDDIIISLKETIIKLKSSTIENNAKNKYLETFREILDTYSIQSYASTISMCGKTVEIYLKEYIRKFEPALFSVGEDYVEGLGIGALLGKANKDIRNVNHRLDKITNQKISLINTYRIGSIHTGETISIPSKQELKASINLVVDLLERRMAADW